jgi:CubicO group peptidase (beta-lactamase class C family)
MRPDLPRCTRLLALLLLVVSPAVAGAQPTPDSLEARVDSLMAPYDSAGSPGGVVGVIREGEVAFAKGYGMADLAHGIPNTPDTRFNLGSASKQFLGFAFALLAERGELSLEDPVAKHLEDWPVFGDTVRIRHLLSHTSGYREAYGILALAGRPAGEHYLPRAEALEVVRRQPELEFPAGSEFQYNSTAFVILAEVAGSVIGDSVAAWMQEEVFGPLGMDRTAIETEVGEVIPGAADSYTEGEDGGVVRSVSNRAIFGAAEVFTTVGDLARWFENFHSADVGGRAVQERLREPFVLTSGDTTGYALGIRVDEHRGLRRLDHGGAHAGYRAQLSYYPELEAGVVVLSNYDEVDAGAIADSVAGFAFGERMEPPPEDPLAWTQEAEAIALDSAQLARYSGTYRSEEDDVVTLEVKGDTLVGNGAFPLVPVADTLFRVQGVDAVVAFRSGGERAVPALTVYQSGEEARYRRIEPWNPTPAELESFTGRYESPELETTYRLTVADAQLVARHRWRGRMPLIPLGEDAFRTEDGLRLEFDRNDVGLVTGFYASLGRTQDVWFGKRE